MTSSQDKNKQQKRDKFVENGEDLKVMKPPKNEDAKVPNKGKQ